MASTTHDSGKKIAGERHTETAQKEDKDLKRRYKNKNDRGPTLANGLKSLDKTQK